MEQINTAAVQNNIENLTAVQNYAAVQNNIEDTAAVQNNTENTPTENNTAAVQDLIEPSLGKRKTMEEETPDLQMYRLILDNIQSRRRGDAVVASTRDFLQKNFPNRDAGRSLSFSFTHAINLGLTDMVKLFIEFGATMETVDFDASLTKIAKSGHIEILCLVSKLIDDNDILVQQYLSVALNQAIIDNKPDLVKILMHEYHAVPRNFGSQVFSETRPWNAAQEFAVKCLQPPAPYLLSIHDLVRCALARLGMKCYKDQDYDLDQFITPLLFAVSKNSVEMVTLLLQTPADLNNALLVACVSNSEPIVTMLIQAGADIHFKGNVIFDPKDNHDDVILIAQHYQHKSLINTLTKLGAK